MVCHWLGGRRLGVSHWLPHRTFALESWAVLFGLPALLPTRIIPMHYGLLMNIS
jgi:hypothetical protein